MNDQKIKQPRVKKNGCLIAVYGTLRKGFGNNRLLQNSKLIDTIRTKEKFVMYDFGGFPCVVPEEKVINKDKEFVTEITVEIYSIDMNTRGYVYSLEGYKGSRNNLANWYNTSDISTEYGDIELFIFDNSPEHFRSIIKSGDYKNK